MMSNTVHRARAQAPPNRAGHQQHPRETDRGPIFIVKLQAQPGADGIRSLRQPLKVLLRKFRLRCLSAREVQR
jgi:hypothetical protein